MNILCIASVEDRENIDAQILKQTVKPDRTVILVDKEPAQGIDNRRKRIAENHKKLKAIVEAYKPDFVWQLEGDVELEPDTLARLITHYELLKDKDFGYISGNQIGRHGLYHVGAWVNFTHTNFQSIDHALKGIQKVDATGFYCLLAPTDVWLSGNCEWNGEPYGPDVVWGLSINKKKYIDMDLEIGHKVKGGIIYPHHISTCTVRFSKENGSWNYKAS